MDTIQSILVPIHPKGYSFVAVFAAITLVLFLVWLPLGWAGLILTFWCAYFFRDPARVTPLREGLIISPADGVIQSLGSAVPPAELGFGDVERMRVSIFMNVFDVHVNRIPADGTITLQAYRPGKFLNAALDKASEDNERHAVRMSLPSGAELAFVQIAGLIARRIHCELEDGDEVKAGQRFGLIRFGSRVDVYLDDAMVPLVSVGQRTIAGETVLADANAQESARSGEIR